MADMHPLDVIIVMNCIPDDYQGIADDAVNPAHSRVHQSFYQMRGYRFHSFARFLLCRPFSAVLEFMAFPGSPVDAFSISPPLSRAMSASNLRLKTERGFSVGMSFSDAYLSRCLINSQDLSALLP